jgi:hypothetical protein
VTAQRRFGSRTANAQRLDNQPSRPFPSRSDAQNADDSPALQTTIARHALRPPAPDADDAEQSFYVDDLDFVWDPDHPARRELRGREQMPTLPDEDPLRYDIGYDRERDATRDSMPTIPDLDPLRHDSDLPSRPDRVEQSYTFRKVR